MAKPMSLNGLISIVKADGLDPDAPLNFRIFQGDDVVNMDIDEVSEGTDDTICIYLSETI
jgi:hypothetical protein